MRSGNLPRRRTTSWTFSLRPTPNSSTSFRCVDPSATIRAVSASWTTAAWPSLRPACDRAARENVKRSQGSDRERRLRTDREDARVGSRVCFVHVGAPKTGSTAIQHFLANNAAALASAGAWYPRAGRCSWRPGHHNLADELRGVPTFDARLGTLSDFCAELDRMAPSRAILSAEDLIFAHDRAEAFGSLREALAAIGYRIKVVLYVRAHDEYVESTYAEAVRQGFTTPFGRYLEDVIQHGGMKDPPWAFPYEFARLADRFASLFSREDVIVRGYRYGEQMSWLIRDFLHAVDLDQIVDENLASWPEQSENMRLTTGEVLRRLAASIAANLRAPEIDATCADLLARYHDDAEMRFAALTPVERERIAERFAGDAERLVRAWGVDAATFERARRADVASVCRARDLFVRGERLLQGRA